MPMQQTFENIVAKEEIAQNKQFSFCHQLYSINGDFLCFCDNNFKVICCRFVACWKGLNGIERVTEEFRLFEKLLIEDEW